MFDRYRTWVEANQKELRTTAKERVKKMTVLYTNPWKKQGKAGR
jgi:tRNA G46 methylase TrmB